MTPDQIALWWCCLSDNKRAAVEAVFDIWLLGLDITPLVLVDTVLAANGFPVGGAAYLLFIPTFQMEVVEVSIDGLPVDLVVFSDFFYTALLDFRDETGFACDQRCYILRFALSHL